MKSTKKPQEAHKATAEAEQQEARELMQSLLAADDLQQAIRELPFDKIYLIYAADQTDADPDKIKEIIIATDEKLLQEGTPNSLIQTKIIVFDKLTRIENTAEWESQREAAKSLREDTERALLKEYPEMGEQMRSLGGIFKDFAADYTKFKESHTPEAIKTISELEIFLHAILVMSAKDNPKLEGVTLWQIIFTGFTKTGKPIKGGKFEKLINEAIEARNSYLQAREQTEAAKIIAKPTKDIEYPLDKPNREIWDLIEGAKYSDQLKLATITIDTSKGKKTKEAAVIYGISFSELEKKESNIKITRQLTQYDKRVYIAAAAVFNAGNEITTPTQIYRAMGNTGRPDRNALKKINDSLTKMGSARVYINNAHETTKYNYPLFEYDAALLPFERAKNVIINDKEVETVIHFFREPPLMSFAKGRKQITTFSVKLLESPVSQTETALAIEDYLIERISHIKEGNGRPKILYATLFDKCNINTKKKKQRAPETIKKYLEYYKQCKFITDYREESDGIRITV